MKRYEFQKTSWNTGGILYVYSNGATVMAGSDGKEMNFRKIDTSEIQEWLKIGLVKEVAA
jgi:hypothetical protein